MAKASEKKSQSINKNLALTNESMLAAQAYMAEVNRDYNAVTIFSVSIMFLASWPNIFCQKNIIILLILKKQLVKYQSWLYFQHFS